MKLLHENLSKTEEWDRCEVVLPLYDVKSMVEVTKEAPTWVHFGAGNVFRGLLASLQQRLLNKGVVKTGVIAVEAFDEYVLPKIFAPCDNLSLNVTINGNGTSTKEVIGSIAEAVEGTDLSRLREIFTADSLQMATFTVTEQGYILKNSEGEYLPEILEDFEHGLEAPKHTISLVTSLLYSRYQAGGKGIALVSMDQCSKNGKKLRMAVLEVAKAWVARGLVSTGFLLYVKSQRRVAFPWTMVDKRTPQPSQEILESLQKIGMEDMNILYTAKGTVTAPFVNGERAQYLVVEERFPNGRPPLEVAGVVFGRRAQVIDAEYMRNSACLLPLYTALSIYSCLLGYETISQGMKDVRLVKLLKCLGYEEGFPTVSEICLVDAKVFLDEVLEQRLPNDLFTEKPEIFLENTSAKMAERFGKTVRSSVAKGQKPSHYVGVPLAIAGWFRYLLAVNDQLEGMVCSADPMLEELQAALSGIVVGEPDSYQGQLQVFLQNRSLFGINLQQSGLIPLIEEMFVDMLSGKQAVGNALGHYLK